MEKSTVVILVCCAYFSIMILVGILVMARNRKASDFLVAGRKLSLPFTVATLSAVQIGAGIILGGSSTAASMGVWPGMWYSLGCGGGLIIAGILVAGKLRQTEANLDELPFSKIISRGAIVFSVVAGILLSFKITDILDAIIIFNYPYMGSLLIPLLAGVLWKGATRKGAVSAIFAGGIIGTGAFLAGIPGPFKGFVNPELGLFYAYIVSLMVLVAVSRFEHRVLK